MNVNYIVSIVTVAHEIQDTRIALYGCAIKEVILGQDDMVTFIEYVNIKSFFDNEGIRVIELKLCSKSSFNSTYFCDIWFRDGTGTGDRSVQFLIFFCFFHMKLFKISI